MPRVGAEKGGRGRRRPRPILGGTCLWRRKSESASPDTPRPVSGVSKGTSRPGAGTVPCDILPPTPAGGAGGSPPTSCSSESGSQGDGRPCGARGACAEAEGPCEPASFPVLPSGRGAPAAAPSPTLVVAPLFGPRCFPVLRKVPAAPEAAVGPATRPQAPEPSANGTPLSQRPWLTRSRRAREVDEGREQC